MGELAFKLIALDVDGTLITDDFRILDRTKKAIRAVAEQGCRIVLCTGRSPDSALPLFSELALKGTLITHNGALTIDGATRRILSQFTFGIERVKPIIAYCRENGIHFDASTAYDVFVEHITEEGLRMYRKYFANPVQLPAIEHVHEPLVKFGFYAEESVLDEAQNNARLNLPGLRIIRSGDNFIDVMHEQASKGAALKEISAQWGIKPAEIMAFGNYYNDMEMLSFAGLGVAMANSPDEVKACADEVTLSNNDGGIHAVLAKYFQLA